MSKTQKAEMINAIIARSPMALAKKCAARMQDGTIFYTMANKRGYEVCCTLRDIIWNLDGADMRTIKGIA